MGSSVIEVEVTPGGSVAGVWLGDVLYPFVQVECGVVRTFQLRRLYELKGRLNELRAEEPMALYRYKMGGFRTDWCVPAADGEES